MSHIEHDDERDELRLDADHARRMHNRLMAHPDPRDPDYPIDDDEEGAE